MIEKDIKQIKDIKELQRIYIELNNDFEKQERKIELLQNDLDNTNSKLKDYVGRCLKAIEYIEENMNNFEIPWKTVLYDILKGIDKDV